MRFKNSEMEKNYNNYWNRYIVSLDNAIKAISLGFHPNFSDPSPFIEQYKLNLFRMTGSLNTHSHKFEDKQHVQNYITLSFKQASIDFSFYATVFPEYMDNCLRFALELEEVIRKREMPNSSRFFSHPQVHLPELSTELNPQTSISPIL